MNLCQRGRIAKGNTALTHIAWITHTLVSLLLCHFQLSFAPTLFLLYFICFFPSCFIVLSLLTPLYLFFLPFSNFFTCSCFMIFFYILPCISLLTCFPSCVLYIWLLLSPSIPLLGDKDTSPSLSPPFPISRSWAAYCSSLSLLSLFPLLVLLYICVCV